MITGVKDYKISGISSIATVSASSESKESRRERTLIIGAGEIGKSLAEVLSAVYEVVLKDKDDEGEGEFRVINICYPYSDKFIEITKDYIEKYKPELTIIHSTVKVGTTRELGDSAVHSPVNGRHPNLQESIKLFIKFIGGVNSYSTYSAVNYLNNAGIRTKVLSSPEATELAKICCTSIQYALSIIAMKEIVRLCEIHHVPFHEVYTEWNGMYNEGYGQLGEYRFTRPVLFPLAGPIGGHCVISNCDLLDDYITQWVKSRNDLYRGREKGYPRRFPI